MNCEQWILDVAVKIDAVLVPTQYLKIEFDTDLVLSMLPVIFRKDFRQFAGKVLCFLRRPQFLFLHTEITDPEPGATQGAQFENLDSEGIRFP